MKIALTELEAGRSRPAFVMRERGEVAPAPATRRRIQSLAGIAGALGLAVAAALAADPISISGIYPHLAFFNSQGECGVGAVVPWAQRLWVVTYSPHSPKGSDDKLYEIDPALNIVARPESVGGTPANRMIHRESQQLIIGPYFIDAQRTVRVLPPTQLFGRLTANARHLADPANKIYYATMEEGFYEVDVRSLAVTELFRDDHFKDGKLAALPGRHGKGLYSGQGRLVYANNGEHGDEARTRPDIPSGVLAAWTGPGAGWQTVRHNQFTDVTGPGGLEGNAHPATDPIWSIGWDHRSLILMVLDAGKWHAYRLPKASHAYDGAHGFNTEWPRIRDIGEPDLLMTMHGAFWRFPRDFCVAHSAGIAPRSNYLKVIGDFARWNDRIVLGCDDTAKNEFLNKRRAKTGLAAPGQSQSNLWFVEPAQLDQLGPAIGRGAVWLDDAVRKDQPSEPYLFSGFDQRMLHLTHDAGAAVTFTLEVDRLGNNQWTALRTVEVSADGYGSATFTAEETGAWIRVRASRDCGKVTAIFSGRNADRREPGPTAIFDGLGSGDGAAVSGGLLHARGAGRKTLEFAARERRAGQTSASAYYEMGPDLKLVRRDEPAALAWLEKNVAIPAPPIAMDDASVIYLDENGRRFRLPKARSDRTALGPLGPERMMREVCTERDLLSCAGTFFEVPAENAGGIAKIRPIATHDRRVHDFASWRGLLVMSGVTADAPSSNPHIVRSDDGAAALWVGAVDDLWQFGKPRGEGGPWKDTPVTAGKPSDPYLMTGYDRKTLTLSHRASEGVRFHVEVDLTGTGRWVPYASLDVAPGASKVHRFPDGFQAYWVRATSEADTVVTAWLVYE